jgi:hypothetical protein
MVPLFFVKMFDRVTQERAWHRCGTPIQKAQESLAVPFSSLAQHPSSSLVNQVVVVVNQDLGDLERVSQIALPDKIPEPPTFRQSALRSYPPTCQIPPSIAVPHQDRGAA